MDVDVSGAHLQQLRRSNELLRAVTKAQSLYFRDADPAALFGGLLQDLLELTQSDYGYIAEVLYDDDGGPFLRTWAITNIAWNQVTRDLYEEFAVAGKGLEFRNLDTLFGWGLLDGGRVVISNSTADDPRCAGRPGGHPPLDSYLGVPIVRGGALIGQFGVSNRPTGYDTDLVEALEPFTVAVGNLIDAFRADRERRQAEQERAATEGRLGAIVEHLSDIVTVVAADGGWVSSSPAGSRLLGYPRNFEIPGGVFALLHPDDLEPASRAFGEILDGNRGPRSAIDLRVRALDGTYRILETVGDNLCDDPAIRGIMLTSRDVTAQRSATSQLEERTAELGALVGSLRDGILFVDRDRNVAFVNQAFCDIFRHPEAPECLIGRSTSGLLPAALAVVADPAAFSSGVQGAYASGQPRVAEPIPLIDGRVLERDFTPIARGANPTFLWIYRDVTERSRLDEERRAVLAQERAMREVIEEQNRSLIELNQLKNEFVATVSHELRTPLTSIVSFAELLCEDGGSMSEEQRDFLEVISRNAKRLLAIVGDLLLIARLESGALAIDSRPTPFSAYLRDVLVLFNQAAAEKQLTLELQVADDAVPIAIDPGRFEQVVSNLVSNAIKFTPAGGTVTVTTYRRDLAWCLEVRDTGIGIPRDEISQLFERFYRASNARLKGLPGTGLGLTITRAIVDLHGGTLAVTSGEVGTTVTVVIPDDAPAADEGGAP